MWTVALKGIVKNDYIHQKLRTRSKLQPADPSWLFITGLELVLFIACFLFFPFSKYSFHNLLPISNHLSADHTGDFQLTSNYFYSPSTLILFSSFHHLFLSPCLCLLTLGRMHITLVYFESDGTLLLSQKHVLGLGLFVSAKLKLKPHLKWTQFGMFRQVILFCPTELRKKEVFVCLLAWRGTRLNCKRILKEC